MPERHYNYQADENQVDIGAGAPLHAHFVAALLPLVEEERSRIYGYIGGSEENAAEATSTCWTGALDETCAAIARLVQSTTGMADAGITIPMIGGWYSWSGRWMEVPVTVYLQWRGALQHAPMYGVSLIDPATDLIIYMRPEDFGTLVNTFGRGQDNVHG